MLYPINDLRVAVETAKRLLTKKQMDKKSGQATTSPFMKASQENCKSKNKAEKNEKKVSFSAVEAIERTTDSIERLASLMDKIDTKLDRREYQYRPRIYQGRGRGCGYRQIIIGPEIGLTAEIGTKIIIEEEETTTIEVVTETTDPIIGIIVGPETETITEMEIDTIIDQTIEGMIVTKGMEVEIRTTVGLEKGIEIGVVIEKVPKTEVAISPQSRNNNRRQSRNGTRDRSESRSRSTSHVSTNRDRHRCYRCNEYVHFAREYPNDVTDGSSDDTRGPLLRMLDPRSN